MSWYAYNPDWPRREAIQAQATRWHKRGLLTAEQLAAVQAAYPLDFYRPHLILRIGLFLFTALGALAATGFVSVVCNFNFLATIIASLIIGAVVLEGSIRQKGLYHSGPDNALLYLELLGFTGLVLYLIGEQQENLGIYHNPAPGTWALFWLLLPMLAALLLATFRYADRLVAAAAYLIALLFLGNVLLMLPFGTLLLPFALGAVSAGAYRWFTRQLNLPIRQYHHRCLLILRGLALATAYLSVNYLVVREGNAALSAPVGYGQLSPEIPLAPLFILFTAAIPLLYLVHGLRRPDRTWLWLGLLTATFSAYTLRYYRSVLPPETAATLVGAMLTAFAIWATRYLRRPRHGLTSAPDVAADSQFNLESLIIAETAHAVPAPAAPDAFQFGGGQSGGGGASGTY